MSERIVPVTLFGVAEKDVERLFGSEVVVFRFVCVPDFRPSSCGVFCHVYRIAGDAQKASDFFTIPKTIFVDILSNERLNFCYDILMTLLRYRISC